MPFLLLGVYWFGVPFQYIDNEILRTYNPAGQRPDGTFHDNQVDNYKQSHYQTHLKSNITSDLFAKLSFNYTRGKGFFEEYIIQAPLSFYGIDDIEIG